MVIINAAAPSTTAIHQTDIHHETPCRDLRQHSQGVDVALAGDDADESRDDYDNGACEIRYRTHTSLRCRCHGVEPRCALVKGSRRTRLLPHGRTVRTVTAATMRAGAHSQQGRCGVSVRGDLQRMASVVWPADPGARPTHPAEASCDLRWAVLGGRRRWLEAHGFQPSPRTLGRMGRCGVRPPRPKCRTL